jgi:hypothetical protein
MMEELFFFQYHMRMSKEDAWSLPIHERKWIIQRFVTQKQREHEALERAKKKMR